MKKVSVTNWSVIRQCHLALLFWFCDNTNLVTNFIYSGSYQNHPEGNYPQAPPEAYKGVPPAGMPSGYPPQQGPYPAPQYGGGYGSTAVPSYTSVTVTQPSVVVVGGCPACRVCVSYYGLTTTKQALDIV